MPIASLKISQHPTIPSIFYAYKLAEEYDAFKFFMLPKFIAIRSDLTSDQKILYAVFLSLCIHTGFTREYSREQLAKFLGWPLSRFRRALKGLISETLILSVEQGSGLNNIYFLVTHSDMGLSSKTIAERTVKLPDNIQRLLTRALNLSTNQNADLNTSQTSPNKVNEPGDLRDSSSYVDQPAGAHMIQPLNLKQDQEDPDQEKKPEPKASPAMSLNFKSHQESGKRKASSIIASNCNSRTATRSQLAKPLADKQRLQSIHSLETCLEFAQAEFDRNRSIQDITAFAQACADLGRHDEEISRWLMKINSSNSTANSQPPAKNCVKETTKQIVVKTTPQDIKQTGQVAPISRHSLEVCIAFAKAEAEANPGIWDYIRLGRKRWLDGKDDYLINLWLSGEYVANSKFQSRSACSKNNSSGLRFTNNGNEPVRHSDPTFIGAQITPSSAAATMPVTGIADSQCSRCSGFGICKATSSIMSDFIQCECVKPLSSTSEIGTPSQIESPLQAKTQKITTASFIDPDADLDQRRKNAFEALSSDERERRIKEKKAFFLQSNVRDKFFRIPVTQQTEKLIYFVQKDLVPV